MNMYWRRERLPLWAADKVRQLRVLWQEEGIKLKDLAAKLGLRSEQLRGYMYWGVLPTVEVYNRIAEYYGWEKVIEK